jgi:SAM-dependent methyltransferase
MKLIKKILPKIIFLFLNNLLLIYRLVFYSRPKFFCNVCSKNIKGYLAGFFPKLSLTCINCFSEGKQRMISLYLDNFNFKGKKILHFAPEPCLVQYINNKKYNEYILGDINPSKSVTKINIENIDYPDNYFDLIICSHVLEHVDDHLAISNLKRVLRKRGVVLLLFPIIDAWKKTYRNKNINNKADRELHFLQWDHLRLYGRDVEDKLSGDGFELKKIIPFGEECIKFGIAQGETLFVLKKNFNTK